MKIRTFALVIALAMPIIPASAKPADIHHGDLSDRAAARSAARPAARSAPRSAPRANTSRPMNRGNMSRPASRANTSRPAARPNTSRPAARPNGNMARGNNPGTRSAGRGNTGAARGNNGTARGGTQANRGNAGNGRTGNGGGAQANRGGAGRSNGGSGNGGAGTRNASYNGHAGQGGGPLHGGRTIPSGQFRAGFGHDHMFRIGQPLMIGGMASFQFGGFWFGIVDPWPTVWLYSDPVYVDYVDGGYFLFDQVHPDMRVAVSVGDAVSPTCDASGVAAPAGQ